jgi:SP family general alpha glucoside:H+ symporter-like MFS transporter
MDDKERHDGIVASENPAVVGEEQDNVAREKTHNEIFDHAKSATAKEQNMSLLQGIRLYPKAVFWSMLISTCICMEGYDLCLLSNFYGE